MIQITIPKQLDADPTMDRYRSCLVTLRADLTGVERLKLLELVST